MTASCNWKVPFFAIWTGQAISMVGSNLVQFALVWWLTETTGSATTLATATIMLTLPHVLIGPFAGVLVDRLPRKWVLIVSDGSIALFTALLSILFWLDVAQPWHVFAILLIRALGDSFQSPTMMSTTPLMVSREQLSRVAGMNATLWGVLSFAVRPMGAMLLGFLDVRGILPLDVLTAVMAVVPVALFRIPQPEAQRVQGTGVRAVKRDLGEGRCGGTGLDELGFWGGNTGRWHAIERMGRLPASPRHQHHWHRDHLSGAPAGSHHAAGIAMAAIRRLVLSIYHLKDAGPMAGPWCGARRGNPSLPFLPSRAMWTSAGHAGPRLLSIRHLLVWGDSRQLPDGAASLFSQDLARWIGLGLFRRGG